MKPQTKRNIIQAAATLASNLHLTGFITGTIYSGPAKHICLPGLHCYSCPGAVGACPIGALQALAGNQKFGFSAYVLGALVLFGVVLGRAICGFLCPFGFLQELLHKIPLRKIKLPVRLDTPLRYLKYAVLSIAVIGLPLLLRGPYGAAIPHFCKWLCPAGTLEGGIPLVLVHNTLSQSTGALFAWKLALTAFWLLAAVLLFRPFCKYLCPLGAFYALFNRLSFYRLQVDAAKCINCGACTAACPMQVNVTGQPNAAECIRCGKCSAACPTGAIRVGLHLHAAPPAQKEATRP